MQALSPRIESFDPEGNGTLSHSRTLPSGTVTGGELTDGETRPGVEAIDSTGLPFGQKVSMMKYLQEILGDGLSPVTIRDHEMGAASSSSGPQAFGQSEACWCTGAWRARARHP